MAVASWFTASNGLILCMGGNSVSAPYHAILPGLMSTQSRLVDRRMKNGLSILWKYCEGGKQLDDCNYQPLLKCRREIILRFLRQFSVSWRTKLNLRTLKSACFREINIQQL
jgi:hypothetical protein